MAGENKAQGSVSFTPIVLVAADADADAISAIHHDIKGSLGGEMVYSSTDDADGWFYSTTKDVSNTDGTNDLISGNFTHDSGHAVATTDHVKFLFVKHSGTTDGTTSTAATLLLNFRAQDPGGVTDVIEIGAGEAFQCKFKDGLDVADIHAESSSGTVRCTIAALIDNL